VPILGGTETSFKKVSLQGNNVQGFLVQAAGGKEAEDCKS